MWGRESYEEGQRVPPGCDGSLSHDCNTAAAQGPPPVNLGFAGTFAILSQSGITDVPASAIVGDVGTSPITGAALLLTCGEVSGKIYTVDAAGPLPCAVPNASLLSVAVADMGIAYDDAAGRLSPDFTELGAGEIGGLTLAPGLYKWGTGLMISTDVTLSGGPNDVWIFQVAGTLNQASATRVTLAARPAQEHLLAGRWRGDHWNQRALRRRRTGQNHDRREHWSIGGRQTVRADCGHSSDECGYPARSTQNSAGAWSEVRTHASHVSQGYRPRSVTLFHTVRFAQQR